MTIADKRDVKKGRLSKKSSFILYLDTFTKYISNFFLRIITDNTDVKKPPIEYNTGIQA